jgi:membrane-bound lytic murein transglycosylase D
MKRNILLITLIITPLNLLHAQYDWRDQSEEKSQTKIISCQTDSLPSDTTVIDSLSVELPEILNEDILNILESWHIERFSRPEENCLDSETEPILPDSVFRKRISSLPFLIPMNYNETVRKCIDLYANRLRNKVRYMMGLSYYYFPMIEEKLDANGLPVELKYLVIVESALNPVAQSRMGASGLWQFMYATGKNSGLEINSLTDERLDPVKATDAACVYLKKLYSIFGDWHLAIAAYNCGEGNVLKAIRRSGGKRDFWDIFPYLPRETRSYLPLYMAAAYIMSYHGEHNICPIMPDFEVSTDTLMVERNLSFQQIADILKIEEAKIKFYNPQYKRDIVPGNVRASVLRLPMKSLYAFIDNEDEKYANRLDSLMAYCKPDTTSNASESRKERITHIVKSGETQSTIANSYGVTVQELQKWNQLSRNTKLTRGRKLSIYIDNGGLVYAAKGNTADTQKASTVPDNSLETASSDPNQKYISYIVKSGDTLSGIASRYRGVTVKNIQTANGLKSTMLHIGQVLKIPQT